VNILLLQKGHSESDVELYKEATSAAAKGQVDFAFMYFNMIARNPDSKFYKNALFATGEYYFSVKDYHDAQESFDKFINSYFQSKDAIFAFAYLLKMAKADGKEDMIKVLEKSIIGLEQLSFLFHDFKEYKYRSAFYKKYKARYFIDRIEIYIDDELFEKVSF
jgi:outer membrane protein assembly factor BamD (BamD/ComL family)